MPPETLELATSLFGVLMAPLVLGGPLRPGHAIGARAALALGRQGAPALDQALSQRVLRARVRAARALAPIDTFGPPTSAEWTLAAALHDLLVAANPMFDAPFRRGAAERILDLAGRVVERVPAAATVGDALSRHAWFARMLDITRRDTSVTWWVGSQTFLGVDPPARMASWPEWRRVHIVRTPRTLLELAPLAVHRAHYVEAAAHFLAKTPLTDLATCIRPEPPFSWNEPTVALIGTRGGRTLATRALARLPAAEVDALLGRATRDLLCKTAPSLAGPVLALHADRALAQASGHVPFPAPHPAQADVAFAQAIGALAALRELESEDDRWREDERRNLRLALAPLSCTVAAAGARASFEGALRGSPPRRKANE